MSDREVLPRQDAESLIRGAANRAAPGSAGEEEEEMYDDDRSSDASDYSYDDDDDDDPGESGWYYGDHEEEEEQVGAGGSAEEEAASAGVGGGPKAEGSARAAATCCICMDPWAPYGAHRICCIPCGHVYGRSCLERWLLRCGNTSAKCPQCAERFKHRHIINLYSPVHLWNDCCLKEIRAQSTSSTSSVHPCQDAISFRISQLEARMEEERRLREEAVRIAAQNRFFEERIAAQSRFFKERTAAQYQLFEEMMAKRCEFFKERTAAQHQLFEERMAAQYQLFEEKMAKQCEFFKEMLAAQSQAIEVMISQGIKERLKAERAIYQAQLQSPGALHGKSPPSMPSLPPPPAPHTHMHPSTTSRRQIGRQRGRTPVVSRAAGHGENNARLRMVSLH